ncbi:hypothetical protein BDZ94DRAFT_1261386 [Collybia nuda]|uniref:Uncharacterized protein n=1 Tax=Collybia nuda TaxID=64659 RepID=A0A9P5Y699_9AGAR|nr:hypothetical protein BDZ94DRAFT_1261386 [Collybia nuda]
MIHEVDTTSRCLPYVRARHAWMPRDVKASSWLDIVVLSTAVGTREPRSLINWVLCC